MAPSAVFVASVCLCAPAAHRCVGARAQRMAVRKMELGAVGRCRVLVAGGAWRTPLSPNILVRSQFTKQQQKTSWWGFASTPLHSPQSPPCCCPLVEPWCAFVRRRLTRRKLAAVGSPQTTSRSPVCCECTNCCFDVPVAPGCWRGCRNPLPPPSARRMHIILKTFSCLAKHFGCRDEGRCLSCEVNNFFDFPAHGF